jgi:hypothetical protein
VAERSRRGAVAETTTTVTDTVSTSAEINAYRVANDVTAYFVANWSGSSMTFEANTTVGLNATNNHAIKIRITYEYDDASATHVKTIWIPIESTLSLLTTTYAASGGTGAIPALKGGSTILPEASITIRQIWLELFAAEATDATTDWTLDANLATDAFAQVTLARYESALASSNLAHVVWDVTAAGLTAAQNLELRTVGITNRMAWIGGWIAVTYEFSPSTSSVIWNSVLLPATDPVDQRGEASGSASTNVVELWIEEPTTITEQRSGVFFHSNGSVGSGTGLAVKVAPQAAYKSFTDQFWTGPAFVALRCDSGGQGGGAGLGLARGRNRITIRYYAAVWWWGTGGFVIVNYTSGKAAAGVGAHNQTRHFGIGFYAADSSIGTTTWTPSAPVISDAAYFLQAVAVRVCVLQSNIQISGVSVLAEYASGEGVAAVGEGYVPAIATPIRNSAAENFQMESWGQLSRSVIKRWAGELSAERMDLEVARTWKMHNPDGPWPHSAALFMTWHAITFEFSGSLVNYTGDGSGIVVRLSRDSDGERLLSQASTTGGAYSFDWYDSTENVLIDARQSSALVGRSDRGLAS